ncbi:MAG: EAL domain-containing protein [Marinagarivorans sp.]
MHEPRFVNVQPSLFDDWDQLKENAKSLAEIVAEQDEAATDDEWRARSHQLQLLLNTMREAVLYFDSQGCLKLANLSAQQWLLESLHIGARLSELFSHWPDAQKQQDDIVQVVRRGTNTWGSKSAIVLRDVTYWLSIDKIATTDLGGQVNGVMAVFTDITDAVLKEKALQEGEMRYRAYMSHSNDGIWCYELLTPVDIHLSVDEQAQQIAKEARLAECNLRFAQMYGFDSAQAMLGLTLFRPESQSTLSKVRLFIEQGYSFNQEELIFRTRHSESLHLQTNASGIVENDKLIRIWGASHNISSNRHYQARVDFLANHDSLTQLPNRTCLYHFIEQQMVSVPSGQSLALLLIDLDRFKEINDTLGHSFGDHLLRKIGERLSQLFAGSNAQIARLGGDEFAICLPIVEHKDEALSVANAVFRSIASMGEIDGIALAVSASIGVSLYPQQAPDLSTLMRFADVAMYYAKSHYKGVALYDGDIDPHSQQRLELMGALGRAIQAQQLVLYFQPKINLKDNQIYAFEALVRWQHPELGLIPPSEFIPLAEMSSLIYPLTRWVLENSISQCQAWRRMGYPLGVAVNLSVRNLMDERIVGDLRKMLVLYNLPADALELEITESMIMHDPERALDVLEQLADLGITLSIDDFGTGYSSLAYLKRLPVRTLKIDYSFVCGMLQDKQDQIIVHSTINLAHNLGLYVVAEGVESAEVWAELKQLGCDAAQGFYLGMPMPAVDSLAWLNRGGGQGVPPVEHLMV